MNTHTHTHFPATLPPFPQESNVVVAYYVMMTEEHSRKYTYSSLFLLLKCYCVLRVLLATSEYLNL